MKYSVFLSEQDKKKLEFEFVSQELRVHLTRLVGRNERFCSNSLINQNWLINRSRTLVGKPIYVLTADDWAEYEPAEYAWHNGEFELCFRRLDVPRFIELLCEAIERGWLLRDEVNELLQREASSFRIVEGPEVEVFSLEQLEEDPPLDGEHVNIRLLVKRMLTAHENKDYSAVLHASATVFETLAKDVVGAVGVQNQTLGSFFARYQKDSNLPLDLQAKVLAVYQARNTTPLAGHGSTQEPTLTLAESITLCEITKALVRIEYSLMQAEDVKKS